MRHALTYVTREISRTVTYYAEGWKRLFSAALSSRLTQCHVPINYIVLWSKLYLCVTQCSDTSRVQRAAWRVWSNTQVICCVCAIYFNFQEISTLSTRWICGISLVLTINSRCFLKVGQLIFVIYMWCHMISMLYSIFLFLRVAAFS